MTNAPGSNVPATSTPDAHAPPTGSTPASQTCNQSTATSAGPSSSAAQGASVGASGAQGFSSSAAASASAATTQDTCAAAATHNARDASWDWILKIGGCLKDTHQVLWPSGPWSASLTTGIGHAGAPMLDFNEATWREAMNSGSIEKYQQFLRKRLSSDR